jgi:membrane associated rhomboid family serine protease
LSVVAMALMAAIAVRAVGVATQDADSEFFQLTALGLLVPLGGWLFALFVAIGQSPVGHLEHFLGFLFGAAVEGIYVLSEKERDRFEEERGQERSMLHQR